MFTLFHGSFEWLMAGGVAFIGVMVLLIKLMRGHILAAVASVLFWMFVFSMHSGAGVHGVMTATFAALLFDTIGIPLLKFFAKR